MSIIQFVGREFSCTETVTFEWKWRFYLLWPECVCMWPWPRMRRCWSLLVKSTHLRSPDAIWVLKTRTHGRFMRLSATRKTETVTGFHSPPLLYIPGPNRLLGNAWRSIQRPRCQATEIRWQTTVENLFDSYNIKCPSRKRYYKRLIWHIMANNFHGMHCPGIEPESQEWESCMIPLHQQCAWTMYRMTL